MEAPEAIYTQVKAVFDADTTTLVGLNAADSTAYVRSLTRVDDPSNRSTEVWPNIEVDIQSVERSPFPGSAETKAVFDTVVTFLVETDRDPGFANQNRIRARLRTKYHGVALSNLVDVDVAGRTWVFSPMVSLPPRRLEGQSPRGKKMRLACPFRLVAKKGQT